MRIGRVEGGGMTAESRAGVDDWAAANDVRCVYFLVDGDDAAAAQVAEDGGFRLTDVRVELRRDAGREEVEGVRAARDDDRDALRAIARTSHRATRFYADPNFPDERCDELYDRWISQSLDGWARHVLVADLGEGPVGYVSCHLDDAERSGSIGLIAIDAGARGGGLGLALSRAAVDWCSDNGAETMSVVTQGRNVGALRTFERAGFAAHELGLWLHKWYA